MSKEAKLKAMWKDLEYMQKDDLMRELQRLNVTLSYEDIVLALSKTYDDLQVADHIFATCKVDDSNSPYPKEFIDEAITKIARSEPFGFVHYGILAQDLQELHDPFLTKAVRIEKSTQYFNQFFALCKRFKLDHFDALVYTINDQFDMAKEILEYLTLLQSENTTENHREVTQFVDRFFQVFAQVNPWLEEQLQYVQATSFIALKSAKGEKMFQSMIRQVDDETEAIYRYGIAYQSMDSKRMRSIYERYQKQIRKDSEYYDKIQKLKRH